MFLHIDYALASRMNRPPAKRRSVTRRIFRHSLNSRNEKFQSISESGQFTF
jgi:hypothetical protein